MEKEVPKDIKPVEQPKVIVKTVLSEFKLQVLLLEKAVNNKDIKQIQKISNTVRKFRKSIKSHHLAKIYAAFLPHLAIDFSGLADFDVNFTEELEIPKTQVLRIAKILEVEIYIQTLYLGWLNTNKHIKEAAQLAENLLGSTINKNRRYLDTLQGKIYIHLSRSYELLNDLKSIRDKLLQGYRNACQNHDEQGQAILINLLLRNYLHYNEYELSYNFVNKTEFPEAASGNELVRYLYYTGFIHAIRGEYQESLSRLKQALRKAPDNTAYGFKAQAQKLQALIELLIGEIPSRETFTQDESQLVLYPYYLIVGSVIKGDLNQFQENVTTYQAIFTRDKLYNIILRLPQIVIKTGLRRINQSYSRISLADIALKLKLPAGNNPEYVVAKAIRDGTLNATIDHENQVVVTKEKNDLYGTVEPQEAYSKRINLCLNLYNQAVKALQYQNPQYDYAEKNEDTELTAEELLNMADIGEF